MNNFKKSKIFFLVVLLVLLTISLWSVQSSNFLIGSSSDGVSLVDRWISKPFHWMEQVKTDISNLIYTYENNEQLKKELFSLNHEIDENASLKVENEQLRQLLDMKSSFSNLRSISTDVISRSTASWNNLLTVDVGLDSNVSDSMIAVANGGLVGSVSKITSHSTTINLLTNEDNMSNISVKIYSGDSQIYGIIKGYDNSKSLLVISKLNSNADIRQGAKVLTSGLGSFNVPDIEVGTVESVSESENSLEKDVFVKLKASLDNIQVLTLVGN